MANPPPSQPNPGVPPVSTFAGDIRVFQQHPAIKAPGCPGVLGALDHYELLSLIGQGGMGLVFKARDTANDRIVAIKLLRPELNGNAQAKHRFAREARHMSQLRHPNVLEVLAVGSRQDIPYFVMPYLERGSLASILRQDAKLDRPTTLRLATGIALALDYAHAKGITHRDLKPGNVLLDPADTPLLTDFGLARTLYNDSLTDVTQAHAEGTAAYLSPQLASLEVEDTRCDIYAFGALLYEMLTGCPPYEGGSNLIVLEKIKRGKPQPIKELRPDAPADLIYIAETAMAREHRDRYASMKDVITDMERVGRNEFPLGCRISSPTLPPWIGRHRFILACSFLLTAILLAAVPFWSGRKIQLELLRTIEGPNTTVLNTALVADWDGDKKPDLLFVNRDELEVVSCDGEYQPSLPLRNPHTSRLVLTLAQDVNGDELDDAFVYWANGTNVHLAAWNKVGNTLKEFLFQGAVGSNSNWGETYSHIAALQIADLDRDGRRELLAAVGTTWPKRPRGLACYDYESGTNKWFYETAGFITRVALQDLNGDGKLDVVAGSGSPDNGNALADGTDDSHAYLYAMTPDGSHLWRTQLCDFFACVEPVTGPAFGAAPSPSLIWVASDHENRSTNDPPETGRILSINTNGQVVGAFDAGLRLMSCLTADLDDDGQPEVLCTDRAGNLLVLNADLSLRRKVPLVPNNYSYVNLRLGAVAPLGRGQEKYVVLTSSQVERCGPRLVGNNPKQVPKDKFHDNSVLITDASLNLVAKTVVAKERIAFQGLSAQVLPPVRDRLQPQILVLGDKAYVFQLKKG